MMAAIGAWRVPMEPALCSRAFLRQNGRGVVSVRDQQIARLERLRTTSVDQKVPLFLDNDEIECSEWKLGAGSSVFK